MADEPSLTPLSPDSEPKRGWLSQPPLLFPFLYLALLVASALDVAITCFVVALGGGTEVNWVADFVYGRAGWSGMVAYKFALVTLFIILCEEIGRRRRSTGRKVAIIGIFITASPMILVPAQVIFQR